MQYRVIGTDMKEYGPVEATVVRDWIRQRRADSRTRIRPEVGSSWVTLGEMPEFEADLKAAGGPALPGGGQAVFPQERVAKLAVASLVLALLSPITLCLSAIAGIITGTIALSRIRKSQGRLGGKGLATAGICISGMAFLMLPILAGLLLPALAKAKYKAQGINCLNNMKQIGLAARIYANDHQDRFPATLADLKEELGDSRVLICPGSHGPSPEAAVQENAGEEGGTSSYEYKPGGEGKPAPDQVILICPVHGHHLRGDGSVEAGFGRRR